MKLWLEITNDKYQLPLAVCDSLKELAEKRKVDRSTITIKASRFKTGRLKFSPYITVEIDDEEDE